MTTRLRKAFHYPDDSDHDHEPDLDEQEQEQIIHTLMRQHDTGNAKYSSIFSVLPVLSTLFFLPALFAPSSSLFVRFLGLCSILSLGVTAFVMWIFGLALSSRTTPTSSIRMQKRGAFVTPETMKLLVLVNVGVCAFLVLVYFLVETEGVGFGSGLYLLPPVMLAVILLTQKVMTSVDPSLLEGLRYEYKGA